YGQDVGLISRQDNYLANLYAELDGEPANALPRDVNGNAYLLLKSDALSLQTSLTSIAQNLPMGRHQLTLVADELMPAEALHRWQIVGYAVSDGNLAQTYAYQISVSWLAFILSALSVIG